MIGVNFVTLRNIFTMSRCPYRESLLKWIWEYIAENQVSQGKESANIHYEKYILST